MVERSKKIFLFDKKNMACIIRLERVIIVKKVISSEKVNYSNSKLKKYALKGLTVLLLSTSLLLSGCGKKNEIVAYNNIKQESIKDDEENKIRINNINLWIKETQKDGEDYTTPPGYILGPNNICYKLTVDDGKAPDGYSLGMDNETIYLIDSEATYYAPEGYILVGDKIVKVLFKEEIDNNKNDYEIYSNYAVMIEDAPLINTFMI